MAVQVKRLGGSETFVELGSLVLNAVTAAAFSDVTLTSTLPVM